MFFSWTCMFCSLNVYIMHFFTCMFIKFELNVIYRYFCVRFYGTNECYLGTSYMMISFYLHVITITQKANS